VETTRIKTLSAFILQPTEDENYGSFLGKSGNIQFFNHAIGDKDDDNFDIGILGG
jgi:hypothetical protein